MANENKEIGDIVKKCKILLLDIEGTTTSISFVKDKLFPYAKENVKQFLDSQWDSDDVKKVVIALRKLAIEDQEKSVDGVVSIPCEDATKEEQIEGVVNNVKWQMASDRKAGPLKLLQGLIWRQGYDKGDIKGHVYDDVLPAMQQWRSAEGKKIYIYSSGSVEAQKLLFGQSIAGDLLSHIDGHFDTEVGAKQEAASYANIVEKVGCQSEEILFLTDIAKEAEAARTSGLNVVLVSREGNSPLPEEAAAAFPVIHSLEQLAATNKRKPDPQDEQPTKVPKTDVEDDVKTNTEVKSTGEVQLAKEVQEEDDKPEQMEVEETPTINKEVKKEKDEKSSEVITTVEEITDVEDICDTPVVDIEPVVTEDKPVKTDIDQTEKMDDEPSEPVVSSDTKEEPKVENGNVDSPPAEETLPSVITEIEEISEKQDLTDIGEVIDDIEPVIEEPPATEDMENLQNVGEVLEKECDEILSKVQNVTNLDNIPLKPLLNTITEESMDTETDSNVVDKIMDTELGLENKHSENVTPKNTKEANDEELEDKKEIESKDVDVESNPKVTNAAPVVKSVESNIETGKIALSSTKETENETATDVASNTEITQNKTMTEVSSSTKDTQNETVTDITSSIMETQNETVTDVVSITKENQNETATVESKTKEQEKSEVLEEDKDVEDKNPPATEENKEVKEEVIEVKVKAVHETNVNGKTANGDVEATNLNGDATKQDELSSRLSLEDIAKVNGTNGESNGTSNGTEEGKGDNKAEVEATDIKVKSVAVEEPHTDTKEQPTEA
ncbi:hypothetical protein ACJJTC_013227 [Scirpophaga incertulas]